MVLVSERCVSGEGAGGSERCVSGDGAGGE